MGPQHLRFDGEKNKHAHKRIPKKGKGPSSGKEPVFSLVERDGKVWSFHVPEVKGATLREILRLSLPVRPWCIRTRTTRRVCGQVIRNRVSEPPDG